MHVPRAPVLCLDQTVDDQAELRPCTVQLVLLAVVVVVVVVPEVDREPCEPSPSCSQGVASWPAPPHDADGA